MKYNFDHDVDASVFLWLDYLMVEENEGFQTYSGALRASTALVSGYNSYSAAHRQFVYDSSISGVTVPSGIRVSAGFIPTGSSGVVIDWYKGQALSTGSLSSPSMAYSYKEINIYFTSSSAQQVLFENKFVLNPRSRPSNENFDAKDLVYPCIFIKSSAGANKPLCFDGCATTNMPVRLVVLAENPYQYRAITAALRDEKHKMMALFSPSQLPFNNLYSLNAPSFDYSSSVTTIQSDSSRLAFIREVSVSDFQDRVNNEIAPHVFGGIVDLDLEFVRFP